MKTALLRLAACALWTCSGVAILHAADEPETKPSSHMKEVLRAKLAEEAKKAPAAPAPTGTATSAPASAPSATPAVPPAPSPTATAAADKTAPVPSPAPATKEEKPVAAKPTDQPATLLPQVEVKKDRITVLDQQIAKQEQDIAREKKNTKPTETDLALNDMKVAKPLAIFGGDSAQFRQRVSSERVELMEAEKDILEAMKLAKTKEEKAKLQKELDEMRAMRRDLEKSLR